ncbi:MAG TPA: hypothetical protein VGJ66_04980 [Pyrinomonadaceae bacterium]|jgi:hypothetical protein
MAIARFASRFDLDYSHQLGITQPEVSPKTRLTELLSPGIRGLLDKLHDNGVARKHRQEFRRISREAGSFLDSNISRSDALQSLLFQVSQRQTGQPNNPLVIALSRIPRAELFHDRWHFINARIQHDKLTAEQFHATVDEFTSLLRSYNSHCALPIFQTFASEYREILMANEKSGFNGFQQSFSAYVTRFAEFVERLNDEFRSLPELSAIMGLPKPL